ncbi:MAG: DUF5683 domain-containing protein [Bacteroidota bacterium]
MKTSIRTLLLGCIVLTNFISAQQNVKQPATISTPVFLVASQDTFLNISEDSLIAASLSPVDTTIREGKNTTIATLASMIVPGTGQIYNESYWKTPVVWGFGYYFYSVYKNQDGLYRQTRSEYEQTLFIADTTTDAGKKSSLLKLAENYRGTRDFYKNQRNLFGWYLAITYLLNVLDAYVDAALYNFEVSPNLQGTNEWRVRMKIPL